MRLSTLRWVLRDIEGLVYDVKSRGRSVISVFSHDTVHSMMTEAGAI